MRNFKIKKSLLVSGIAMCLFSCMDVLDKKPLDLMTEDNVWNDINLAQAAIYNFYGNVHYFTKYDGDGHTRGTDCQTDQFWTHWQLGNCTDDAGWTTSTDFGWDKFSDVRKANIAIEHLTDPAIRSSLGEKAADNLLGQAYFLKAATYFLQARKFGGWIIVDKTLDDFGENAANSEEAASALQLPRSTMKETYDYIIDLCGKAATLMNKENKFGELSKGAAYALLSEVNLHGAIYMQKYENVDPTPYLEGAIKAVENLDLLGLYSLVTADDYGKMFKSYEYAQSCPEIILNMQRNSLYTTTETDGNRYFIHPTGVSYLNTTKLNLDFQPMEGYEAWGYGTISPTPQHIERAYYVIDTDGKARRFEESNLFRENVDIVMEEDVAEPGKMREKRKLKPTSQYDNITDLLYTNRDKRFYASIAYDGAELFGNKIYMRTGGNYHPLSYIKTNRERGSVTGYVYKKFVVETQPSPDKAPVDLTRPIFRLGRCYLNAAEAYLHLGDEKNARKYINKTRVNHGGLPELLDESGEELKKIYIDERDAELDLENDRYWTLMRTSIAWGVMTESGFPDASNKGGLIPILNGGDQNGENVATIEIEVSGDAMNESDFMKPDSYFFRELYSPQTDRYFRFTPEKRYLFPVPQSEIDQNENINCLTLKKVDS